MTTTEAETKPQEVADAAPAPSEPFTGSIPQQTGNIPDPFGDEKFDKIVDEAADKAMPEPKYEGPAKPWEEQSDVASTGSEGEAEGDGEGGAEAGTAPGQGQQKAAANEAEKSPDRATREQLVKARRALARDGWDDADIDNIQKSVGTERFIEKGQKAAERQRAIDRQQRDIHKNKDLAKQA